MVQGTSTYACNAKPSLSPDPSPPPLPQPRCHNPDATTPIIMSRRLVGGAGHANLSAQAAKKQKRARHTAAAVVAVEVSQEELQALREGAEERERERERKREQAAAERAEAGALLDEAREGLAAALGEEERLRSELEQMKQKLGASLALQAKQEQEAQNLAYTLSLPENQPVAVIRRSKDTQLQNQRRTDAPTFLDAF
ncbi:hypothetical protein T492DRAFT_843010 [Pavlovales sp. CCMP2436]|nr:hypothetical protein T492DRAFT_843010 [Pavlovales sp. CCMP2436]